VSGLAVSPNDPRATRDPFSSAARPIDECLRYLDFTASSSQIYFADHPPPHFHANYAGQTAKFDIDQLSLIDGKLPARAHSLVVKWATLHQEELREAFRKAANLERPEKIAPLA